MMNLEFNPDMNAINASLGMTGPSAPGKNKADLHAQNPASADQNAHEARNAENEAYQTTADLAEMEKPDIAYVEDTSALGIHQLAKESVENLKENRTSAGFQKRSVQETMKETHDDFMKSLDKEIKSTRDVQTHEALDVKETVVWEDPVQQRQLEVHEALDVKEKVVWDNPVKQRELEEFEAIEVKETIVWDVPFKTHGKETVPEVAIQLSQTTAQDIAAQADVALDAQSRVGSRSVRNLTE